MAKQSIRQPIKFVAIVLIALLALVGQSLVMAQSSTSTTEVEVVGTVTALTNQTLTLGTQSFDISRAEVKAGVAVGKLVKIHATLNTAGQWVAREVELAQPVVSPTIVPQTTPDPEATVEPTPVSEFEITGTVTALTDSSLTVAGQVINITNAEVKDSFTVNSVVKLHVSVVNGVWVAREVELAATTIPGNPTLVPTLQGNNGNDDGPGHDANDDHGNHNGNDDGGNHGGDDNGGNDNHGGNSGSGNSGSGNSNGGDSGHGGGNGSGGHGHG